MLLCEPALMRAEWTVETEGVVSASNDWCGATVWHRALHSRLPGGQSEEANLQTHTEWPWAISTTANEELRRLEN